MDPLAYFITWTTYGSWLHGDPKGWVESGIPGIQDPDAERQRRSRERMTGDPVLLTAEQRLVVEETIRAHCHIRGWKLHALNVRTNHVHLVLTASVPPETVMAQLKAWCSRRLSEHGGLTGKGKNGKRRWWTEHGSTKWINDEDYLNNAIRYTLEGQ
jgi:REP element-mobilizing transposase RayT